MMPGDAQPPAEEPATKRRTIAAQNISRMCLVCGADNPFGLQARFYELEAPGAQAGSGTAGGGAAPAAGRELLGVFTLREEHQSYPGRLHGGISSAILDETIGRAITIAHPGVWGVTAELTLRYRKPLPLTGEVRAVGRITRDTRRLFEGSGEILLDDGSVAVEASGKYLKMALGEITDDDFDQREWFTDPRERPDQIDL
jgi:acyl-coenzyme A thioesterase PaaI-like protein